MAEIPLPRIQPIPEGAADYEGEPAGPQLTMAGAGRVKRGMVEKRKQKMLRFNRKMDDIRGARVRRNVGRAKMATGAAAGLGALAGLGAFALMDRPEQKRRQDMAIEEFKRNQRRMVLDQMSEQSQRIGMQDSIQRNLQTVQQNAPDLYLQVMTGRRLPQGAVVLGGEPRNDLLQELGRAMAEGQFSR